MKMQRNWIVALAATVMFLGCAIENSGEEAERVSLAKADTIGTCVGSCGQKSEGNCWCNESCKDYGDCCDDFSQVCEPESNDVAKERLRVMGQIFQDGDVLDTLTADGYDISELVFEEADDGGTEPLYLIRTSGVAEPRCYYRSFDTDAPETSRSLEATDCY